jgi:hypothetical protein
MTEGIGSSGGTARAVGRLSLIVVAAVAVAWIGPAQGGSAPGSSCGGDCAPTTDALLYNPAFAPAPPAQASGSGGRSQRGETWEGTAPLPDLGQTGSADIREFQVLSGFDNDSLNVTISWDAGPELSYDLDLFVDRLDQFGNWVEVGRSTGGQLLGDGEALETAIVRSPPPGAYRTRVVNFASTELAYQGSIGFAAVKGAAKPSRGRATEDRPDAVLGSQLHVLYFVPSDGVDEALDTNGVLDNAVASMNLWLEGQSGGRHLRLDSFVDRKAGPRLDISFVRGNRTNAEYAGDGTFEAVTTELEERGWTASPALKRYLVYYAGPAENPNVCGTAFLPIIGDFAQWSVVFLDANPGCGARDFGTPATGAGMSEAIALQELVHNEGIAPLLALHQCWAFSFHICTAAAGAVLDTLDPEAVDVMFPFVTFPLRDKVLDPGREDYFEHPFVHRDFADSPFWEG